ncbi:hypothetical protein VTK73DRAFT_8754 [Phialemonium thermophilum]|uniref:Uncharacterized protein n=1 Tax=Phialemonium thermophilum TaxID=223376 RepID=A0ABR3W6S3_9PEZI
MMDIGSTEPTPGYHLHPLLFPKPLASAKDSWPVKNPHRDNIALSPPPHKPWGVTQPIPLTYIEGINNCTIACNYDGRIGAPYTDCFTPKRRALRLLPRRIFRPNLTKSSYRTWRYGSSRHEPGQARSHPATALATLPDSIKYGGLGSDVGLSRLPRSLDAGYGRHHYRTCH